MFSDIFDEKPKGIKPKRRIEDPREFLMAVMNEDPEVMNSDYLVVRMKAAIELLPYSHPKLAVTAVVSENDFAALLDRRLERMKEVRQIEAKPNNGGEKVDARLPPPIPDRRFRRI
jgi:hypothetical protein